jgi:hypothetical protein
MSYCNHKEVHAGKHVLYVCTAISPLSNIYLTYLSTATACMGQSAAIVFITLFRLLIRWDDERDHACGAVQVQGRWLRLVIRVMPGAVWQLGAGISSGIRHSASCRFDHLHALPTLLVTHSCGA